MLPTRKNHQGWLPSIFNDFFDNDWMEKANATAPAINVVEHETTTALKWRLGYDKRRFSNPHR